MITGDDIVRLIESEIEIFENQIEELQSGLLGGRKINSDQIKRSIERDRIISIETMEMLLREIKRLQGQE